MIDFLCVTSPKSGTTSLQHYLIQHPQLFLPVKKELQFFNFNWNKGMDWYLSHFEDAKDEQIIGEITPTYLIDNNTVKRIHATLGEEVKFIFMLRNPVDRLISEHQHNRRRRHTNISLVEAISTELSGNYSKHEYKYYNIVNNSRYYDQAKRLLDYYDLENIFFVILEDDFSERRIKQTLNEICRFLGVEEYSFSDDIFSNKHFEPRFGFIQDLIHKDNFVRRLAKKALPKFATRKRIRELIFKLNANNKKNKLKYSDKIKNDIYEKYFVNDILKFEELINRDLTIWRR